MQSAERPLVVRRKSIASSCSSSAASNASSAQSTDTRLPRWLEEAQRRIFASDEFRTLSRDLVRCVKARNPAGLSATEQHKLVDDTYNRIVDAESSGPSFEALVSSEMDAALCNAVAAHQVAATKPNSATVTIERYAATGIVGLLSVLPRDEYQGALASLIGRALPRQLRVPLWTRSLQHRTAEEEFHRLRRIDRIAMTDDESLEDRCTALLGKHIDDLQPAALSAMKSALS